MTKEQIEFTGRLLKMAACQTGKIQYFFFQ